MSVEVLHREFKVGTTGWSVDDLDDSEIEGLWCGGKYEIVEGVLTEMAAAHFDGGSALEELLFLLRLHMNATQVGGKLATEVDVILGKMRLPRPDALYLSSA